MKYKLFYLMLCMVMLFSLGCGGPSVNVTRTEADTVTDLSGDWNDTDSRMVSEEMIPDCLSRPWLGDFTSENMKKPVVIVGYIRNKTDEHIATETFVNDLERELVNSGKVSFVAEKEIREALRDEKYDQSMNASAETMKEMGRELGADFMLFGSINSITDQIEGKKAKFYQIDLELIDIETNEKVWLGQKKIKKIVERDKYRF
ncbi:MAG: penicillin-binding protein activator LpoB [Candidatus Krumholzibacteriota bacterium]|nr:penicillin-binding protein activator LpoB [Candidatus Krumholzibacteriota bacterium]